MACNCKTKEHVQRIEKYYNNNGGKFLMKKTEKRTTSNVLKSVFNRKNIADIIYRFLLVSIGFIVMIPIGMGIVFIGLFSRKKIFDYQKLLGLKKRKIDG